MVLREIMGEQLVEAAVLLGVGMSVVFAFLILLIGGVNAIAWFAKTFPEPTAATFNGAPTYNKKTNTAPATVEPAIASAIGAAINTHRREHQQ